jgi:hypothetical protein
MSCSILTSKVWSLRGSQAGSDCDHRNSEKDQFQSLGPLGAKHQRQVWIVQHTPLGEPCCCAPMMNVPPGATATAMCSGTTEQECHAMSP